MNAIEGLNRQINAILYSEGIPEYQLATDCGFKSAQRFSDMRHGLASGSEVVALSQRLRRKYDECCLRLMVDGVRFADMHKIDVPGSSELPFSESLYFMQSALQRLRKAEIERSNCFNLRIRSSRTNDVAQTSCFLDDTDAPHFIQVILPSRSNQPGRGHLLFALNEIAKLPCLKVEQLSLRKPKSTIFSPSVLRVPSAQVVGSNVTKSNSPEVWVPSILRAAEYGLRWKLDYMGAHFNSDRSTIFRWRNGNLPRDEKQLASLLHFCDSALPALRTLCVPFHRMELFPLHSSFTSEAKTIDLAKELNAIAQEFPDDSSDNDIVFDLHVQQVDLPNHVNQIGLECSSLPPNLMVFLISPGANFFNMVGQIIRFVIERIRICMVRAQPFHVPSYRVI